MSPASARRACVRRHRRHAIAAGVVLVLTLCLPGSAQPANQPLSREQWGAPAVNVSHASGKWTIAGNKQTVILNEADLALEIRAQSAIWNLVASAANDMRVKFNGQELPVRLADARNIAIAPYDTGFKSGVKINLSNWPWLDLSATLTICLEGRDEDLVFEVAVAEGQAVVRQLDWPTALDARAVDYTILSNGRGNLLPRHWPKEYFPIRTITNEGKVSPNDHSVLQSHRIEDWSMSWWGFQKGLSAMMVIVETPDDAAYQFQHPAGGPTVIGPRWLASLGKFAYMRSACMCFFPQGNYVTLAKRYRRYVMERGLFVSVNEKLARTPVVARLIGTPQTPLGILHNQKSDSDRYDAGAHYNLTTFDERARQLRALKARGIDRTLVFISGWPHLGYDRQHPDSLPPPEAAGGWEGMKQLADTCRALGYPFLLHDQYRDYYVDAPSYDPQFAIHEEDTNLPPRAFPGSRFGDWKEGPIPFMRHWDGGKQSYLNARLMPGHLRKNYQLFFDHQIHPQGIYLDVFGYVPPDEDFNPEHPTTRTQAMRAIAECFEWSRQNLGIVATEAGADWVIPYVDSVNQSGAVGKCIPVPLYNLVYHDAVFISYGAGRAADDTNLLLGILCGGVPELPIDPSADNQAEQKSLALIKQMAALNKRVCLLEMTGHEFLDEARHQERSTFADGTTVTVDWQANTVKIQPPL
jgi:hypothetical protein